MKKTNVECRTSVQSQRALFEKSRSLLKMVLQDPASAMNMHKDALNRLSIGRKHETAWYVSASFARGNGDVLAFVKDNGFRKRSLNSEQISTRREKMSKHNCSSHKDTCLALDSEVPRSVSKDLLPCPQTSAFDRWELPLHTIFCPIGEPRLAACLIRFGGQARWQGQTGKH